MAAVTKGVGVLAIVGCACAACPTCAAPAGPADKTTAMRRELAVRATEINRATINVRGCFYAGRTHHNARRSATLLVATPPR